jgi:hypothetical protein
MTIARLLIIAMLLASSGCSTLGALRAEWPWSEEKKREAIENMTPVRIVTFWSEMVLNSSEGPPVRGFGGRVYFYNKYGKPVKVNGTLTVYAYDDTDKNEDTASRSEADFTFIYKPEEFANYYSKSEMGESYSIWLPWDSVGGEEREISLLPKFVDMQNNMITGQMSLNILPGKKAKAKLQPLSDAQRFLKKQLESQYGKDVDVSPLMGPTGAADSWVNQEVMDEVKSRRRSSKSIPVSPELIRAMQNEPVDQSETLPPPKAKQSDEYLMTPSRVTHQVAAAPEGSSAESSTTRLNSDPTAMSPRSRRFRSEPRQPPSSSSLREQGEPSLPRLQRSHATSPRARHAGPEPVVTLRPEGSTEFEQKPSWIVED